MTHEQKGPEFNILRTHMKKLSREAHACHPRAVEMETGGCLEFSGQPVKLNW